MMQMCCNLKEALRLREEIVLRMNECNILARIYSSQCDLANKQTKIVTPSPLQFETQTVLKDFVNLVDMNDGLAVDFDLRMPFMEFDSGLKSNLDFKSSSCIKALFTNLGVEELRAILHCQIMHHQLLTVAVIMNDTLIS